MTDKTGHMTVIPDSPLLYVSVNLCCQVPCCELKTILGLKLKDIYEVYLLWADSELHIVYHLMENNNFPHIYFKKKKT